MRYVGNGFACDAEQGLASIPTLFLGVLPLPDSDRVGDPPLLGVYHPDAFLVDMAVSLAVYFWLTLPDAP